jgi:hypothetical protein
MLVVSLVHVAATEPTGGTSATIVPLRRGKIRLNVGDLFEAARNVAKKSETRFPPQNDSVCMQLRTPLGSFLATASPPGLLMYQA